MTPAWVCFDLRSRTTSPRTRTPASSSTASGCSRRTRSRTATSRSSSPARRRASARAARPPRSARSSRAAASRSRRSFAPIHARNNINIGQLMGDHAMLRRLEAGESIPLSEFTRGHDAITALIIESGGLLPFCARLAKSEIKRSRARHRAAADEHDREDPRGQAAARPGHARQARRRGARSRRRRLLARVHDRAGRLVPRPTSTAPTTSSRIRRSSPCSRTTSSTRPASPSMAKFADKIEKLRDLQRAFAGEDRRAQLQRRSTASRPASAIRSRASSSSIPATSSRRPTATPAWAARRARSRGASARPSTRRSLYWGFTPLAVPESIRFELTGTLPPGRHREGRHAPHPRDVREARGHAQPRDGVRRRRACSRCRPTSARRSRTWRPSARRAARSWRSTTRCCAGWSSAVPARTSTPLRAKVVSPDPGAHHDGGVHSIDLASIRPMVATPGDPDRGIASDPKNGALIPDIGKVKIDIAYGGSCTAGKRDDIDMYARVMAEAETRRQARRRRRPVLHPVRLAGGRGLREAAGLPRAVRAHRRRGHQARLRRVHRLRPRRLRPRRSGRRSRRSTATTRAARARAGCTWRRR